MAFKEIYQKHPQVIIWGAIGFVIGLITIALLLTPLAMYGLFLGLPAFFVYNIFAGVGEPFDIGYGFLPVVPLVDLAIGLMFGLFISKLGTYAFGQESNPDALSAKKRGVIKCVIVGGIIGAVFGLVSAFPFAKAQTKFLQAELQTFNAQREMRGERATVGGEQYSYAFNLRNSLASFPETFAIFGALIGLAVGLRKARHG